MANTISTHSRLLVILLLLAPGCATQNLHPVLSSQPILSSQTAQLKNGMTPAEVHAILGSPAHVESWPESLLWTYPVSQSEGEIVQTTIKFDQKTQTLKDWQTLWLNTSPVAPAFVAQAPVTPGYFWPLSYYIPPARPTYKVTTKVIEHGNGRTTYKTKIKRKY